MTTPKETFEEHQAFHQSELFPKEKQTGFLKAIEGLLKGLKHSCKCDEVMPCEQDPLCDACEALRVWEHGR